MTPCLLVDECLGRDLVERFRAAGYDVAWVKEACPNATDAEVLERAFDEGRIVLTDGYDFGSLIFRGQARAVGIAIVASVLFDGRTFARNEQIIGRLEQLSGELAGNVTIVEPERARQRRLPASTDDG